MEKVSLDYKYLYIDNNWVVSYKQLCDVFLGCSDASSTLAKEFIEASANGVLSDWLRQIGKTDKAEALEQLVNNDDDKEYIDEMKKIILGNTPDIPVSKRPALKEYAELVEVCYRFDNGLWKTLHKKAIVAQEGCNKCDLKFVFRPKKAIKLVYPLSLIAEPKDSTVVETVPAMLKKDSFNQRKSEEEIMALAKPQTINTIDDCRLKLAGKTSKEQIEIIVNDVLPADFLRTKYDYRLTLRVDPDGELWGCSFLFQRPDFLLFKVKEVHFCMKLVKGGGFQMGGGAEDMEKPQHLVELQEYYIGETAVTQKLWEAVGCDAPTKNNGWDEKGKGKDYPAYNVTWMECKYDFIKKINEILKDQLPEDFVFALPTEAQWEYAARGGHEANPNKSFRYSGSDDINEVAWYKNNSSGHTHPVIPFKSEKKISNELGLFYMSGNVWEWCEDWYENYASSPEKEPEGPSSGLYRVLRGGSVSCIANKCRVTYRNSAKPSSYGINGFRLALVHRSTRTVF